MAKASLAFALALLTAVFLSACESGKPPAELESLNSQLKDFLKKAEQKIEGLTPETRGVSEATSQEVEKLFTFEYKVVEFKTEASSQEIEARLQALGQDRWECFSSEGSSRSLRIFCRRRPKTYLRYIPRLIP